MSHVSSFNKKKFRVLYPGLPLESFESYDLIVLTENKKSASSVGGKGVITL